MGSGSKYLVMLAIAATCVQTATAWADDWPEYDRRIEKWAAEKISGKLGELRGGFDHGERIDAVIVNSANEKPKPRAKPATRIFVLPTVGEPLPPIVSNGELPPGVDPMITGSNAHPTGNARHAPAPRREALLLPVSERAFPTRTSMLID